jgi:molybdopterin synthase sulfur carrier subunit
MMAQLLYFAWVRERIGRSEETLTIPASVATVADLIAHLQQQGNGYQAAFKDAEQIRVAVNQMHAHADHPVTDKDEIAFFPPVTGG